MPRLFKIHSNIIFPSKWSQWFWHFDESCVGIFHFSLFWDYLLKITRNDTHFIYIPFFYETFVLCFLDSSYCDAPPPHIYIYVWNLDPCLFTSLFAVHTTLHSKNWAYLTACNKEDSMINVSCSRSKDSTHFQIQERKDCCKTPISAQADGDTNI